MKFSALVEDVNPLVPHKFLVKFLVTFLEPPGPSRTVSMTQIRKPTIKKFYVVWYQVPSLNPLENFVLIKVRAQIIIRNGIIRT